MALIKDEKPHFSKSLGGKGQHSQATLRGHDLNIAKPGLRLKKEVEVTRNHGTKDISREHLLKVVGELLDEGMRGGQKDNFFAACEHPCNFQRRHSSFPAPVGKITTAELPVR